MATYRTKELEVEAMIFTDDPSKLMELGEFTDSGKDGWISISYADRANPILTITTPEGDLKASVGDSIVKFDDGSIYLYTAENFAQTFEAVE